MTRVFPFCSVFLFFTLAFFPAMSRVEGQLPIVRIGIVLDGPWEKDREMLNLFEHEVLDLTGGEFDVRFPLEKRVTADWTAPGVKAAIDQLLADPEIDLIIAAGQIASHDICRRGPLPKPAIAPIVIDVELQEIPIKDGTSGVKNLNYLTYPAGIYRDLEAFLEIVPFEKLTVFASKHYLESLPVVESYSENISKQLGIESQRIKVGTSAEEALAGIPPDAQAVYVAPLFHLPPGEFDILVQGLIDRKLPSFSLYGTSEVELGIMAALKPFFIPRLARRVALNIQRILLGEEAGSLPVGFSVAEKLTINMATARAVGVSPGWGVLTEAELIDERRPEISRRVDLKSVAMEAREVNLDLAAMDRSVAAGEEEVNEARSSLLPQLDVSALGVVIDEDRAEASFGQQAERTFSGSLSATQVIFSEPAWANLSIQNDLQETREWKRQQLVLDITLESTTAYLNVLRLKTLENIQKENLKLTRSNLDMARVREMIGSAGPAEVYRWESQIASNRKVVIEASANRNLAEIQLNRILNRPLEEPFVTVEDDINDSSLFAIGEQFSLYTGDRRSFRIFRKAMVEECLNASPELAALDAAIAAQERVLSSANYSFWTPTVALEAKIENRFSENGAGTGSALDPALSIELPERDDTDWNVGLSASFPIFSGGSRTAARRKALEELEKLELEQKALAERIEQRIRSALHNMGASYAGIWQARKAAEASAKTLNVVGDAYAQGTVSILDLIDAQNNDLVADLVAADAVFEFFIDMMETERAAGKFSLFMSEDEKTARTNRIEAFYKNSPEE